MGLVCGVPHSFILPPIHFNIEVSGSISDDLEFLMILLDIDHITDVDNLLSINLCDEFVTIDWIVSFVHNRLSNHDQHDVQMCIMITIVDCVVLMKYGFGALWFL